ncbi:MAG: glutamine--fructose-6-phosphate transaminase (isomerizing) [Kiritimatiellae bacterium]|nr:glutamine--fructose-6-phosphate transaminase (isomerizing) [Kiritimatiellia bacterium]
MCGIVGYVGKRNAVPVLMDGLRRLEYRGYDSAGVALVRDGQIALRKTVGKLDGLQESLLAAPLSGTPGIGHTRWATHGAPSEANAHPHLDRSGRIAVVHNGIIENYQALRAELEAKGCTFRSETDTEVVPHLIAAALEAGAADFGEAARRALGRLRGSYALAVLFLDEPDALYAARLGSPLILGHADGEQFIASDVPAILGRAAEVTYLEDGELARLTRTGAAVCTLETGAPVSRAPSRVDLEAEAASKAGFDKYMLKEIHEQPRVLRGLLQKYVVEPETVALPDLGPAEPLLKSVDRITVVSCGTAFHAGMVGKLLIEHFSSVSVEAELASEFRYRAPKLAGVPLVMAISQSGETADTLASVRLAKAEGRPILSICNVAGSTLVRESDGVLFTAAGPEIGVASTKAYTAQLMCLALLAIHTARLRGEMSKEQAGVFLEELQAIPNAVHYVLARQEQVRRVAMKHHSGPSALYLGRYFNYPTALEGALKNKEISYQHAEGYAAGEMKHGPIALVDEYLPVVCVCTKTESEVYEKTLSNVKEVQARNGRIIALATDGDSALADIAEDVLFVPPTLEAFSPIVNAVALQLLAYYAAQARGLDIDKPRNLAKSVTVE